MLRPQAVRSALQIASRLGRSPACPSSLAASLLSTTSQCPSSLRLSLLSTTAVGREYPKEGVFQTNSPPRNIPGFGPAPPIPHQSPRPALEYGYPPGTETGPTGFRRWMPKLRWYKILGAVVFFAVGYYQTQVRLLLLVPLEQDSEEDAEELGLLFEELEEIPLVQQLRQEEKYVDGEGYRPKWREWTAYQAFNLDGTKSKRLTSGPMGGSAGVAAQKVFWCEDEQQLFLFVSFGPGTQGWPQVVHGGAISTICDEGLGRVAILSTKAKTAVTANLDLTFVDKVMPGQWHVLVAGIDAERRNECTDRKKYVSGILACCGPGGPNKDKDSLNDLHSHAVAKGLFVVPKTTQLNAIPDEF